MASIQWCGVEGCRKHLCTETIHLAGQEKMTKRLAHQNKQAVSDTQIGVKDIQDAGGGVPPESIHRINTLGRGMLYAKEPVFTAVSIPSALKWA